MNNLNKFKRKILPIIVESIVLFVGAILFLPLLIEKYTEYFSGERYISYLSFRTDVYGFVGIPFLICYGTPLLKRLVGIMVDLRQGKKETVVVKSSRNSKKNALFQPVFFKDPLSENAFYYWKCKLNKFSSVIFVIPDTIKGPKGYSEGNYYLVTYYKNSKLVDEVKGPLDPKKISLVSGRFKLIQPEHSDGSVLDPENN